MMDSDNEPEILFKWTNSCRLCLSTNSIIDLFSQDSSQDVLKKLRSCFNLLIYLGDPMPRKICTDCLVKLDDWYEFKEKCLKTENDIKRRLENHRKIDFVQDYLDKCVRFLSSEVVSSSKISATHEEINSSVVSNINEDDNRSNSTNSSQTCGSSNCQEAAKIRICTNLFKEQTEFNKRQNASRTREIAVQVDLLTEHLNPFYEQPYRKEVGKNYDEVATIENITGSASALWDVPLDDEIEEIAQDLIHHEIIIKQEINTTTCTTCGVDFPSDEDFAFHTCNAFQNDETDFYSNYSDVRKPKITPWKCEACGDYYKSKAALNEHYYSSTCKGDSCDIVSCKFCKRKFFSKSELYQHQLCHVRVNHHLLEDDLYCCRKCTLRFCTLEKFNQHYKKHLAEEAQYLCNTCGKEFTKKDVYLAHVKNHNTSRTEMMKLKLSESTSSQENSVLQSSKRCLRCGKFFADDKELEKHRLLMHKNPTPFSCRLCNHKFSARSQLLFHIRSHRGKKPTAETSKSCRVCNAKFMLSSDLQSHMMTHNDQEQNKEEVAPTLNESSGSDPKKDTYLLGHFKCSLCPRIFARLNSVPKHMKLSHNGQKGVALKLKRPVWVNKWSNLPIPYKKTKFQCNLCPKFFYSKDNLNLHVEKGHAIKQEVIEDEAPEENSNKVEQIVEVPFRRKPSSNEKQCLVCKNIYSKKYIHAHIRRAHPDYRRALITGAKVRPPPVVRPPVQPSTSTPSAEEKKPAEKRVLKCRHCFRLCFNDYAHRRHEESCAKIQKTKCTVCGIKLHSKVSKNHVENCKSIRCRKCNKIFFKYVAYLSHTCTNVRGDKIKCADCFTVFQTQEALESHVKETHERDINAEPKVENADATTSEKLLVPKKELPDVAEEEFIDVEMVNNDLPGEVVEALSGPLPGPALAAPPKRKPVRRFFSKKKKKKSPKKELWLEESNKIVTPQPDGKFYCTYCDLYFFTPEASVEHQTKHPRGNFYAVQINDHLFQCTVCDKKYNVRRHCLIHINYHKKNSKYHSKSCSPKKKVDEAEAAEEQKLYQCSVCPSAFTTERSFNIHSYFVHSDVKSLAPQ